MQTQARLPDCFLAQHTKTGKIEPKKFKWPQKTSNGYKNTNISSPKTLQNITKLGFSVCKNTIWQP
jgi:hypothetical protein